MQCSQGKVELKQYLLHDIQSAMILSHIMVNHVKKRCLITMYQSIKGMLISGQCLLHQFTISDLWELYTHTIPCLHSFNHYPSLNIDTITKYPMLTKHRVRILDDIRLDY